MAPLSASQPAYSRSAAPPISTLDASLHLDNGHWIAIYNHSQCKASHSRQLATRYITNAPRYCASLMTRTALLPTPPTSAKPPPIPSWPSRFIPTSHAGKASSHAIVTWCSCSPNHPWSECASGPGGAKRNGLQSLPCFLPSFLWLPFPCRSCRSDMNRGATVRKRAVR